MRKKIERAYHTPVHVSMNVSKGRDLDHSRNELVSVRKVYQGQVQEEHHQLKRRAVVFQSVVCPNGAWAVERKVRVVWRVVVRG